MQIALKEEAGIQLTQEEFDFMADAGAYEEIERVNANCTLKDNLQQASTSGTQTDKAPVYDSDESAEVHHSENCYDNDIFNMFTQEEQYTELLEPIPESHQVPQNDSNVISEVSSVEQSGGTVEQHPATPEETRALYDSLYNNLATEVEKVNSVNRKLRETNADLTTELARYKNQEKCFEISQEKYDKLERCYQKSVYQEQCLTKKINALHLSSGKQITTLNEEISNLNKQLSKEKSTFSPLLEEKKRLKSDFKIREDELLDKKIQRENMIKELDNILVKTGQSIQTMHMLSPKPDSFYHTEQKMALGYQNPFYLKQAQQKQQSLYNGKVLLEKHDPPVVYDSEETLELAQEKADESLAKHKALELEIKRLLRAVISQDIMSIVQNNYENEYAKLWNDWYKKCEECKYGKILYDKAYNDMQQKIERLQAQLGDLKELEFQVRNYERENAHLKTTYKNLFDSIKVTRAQTKAIIDSLQDKLHDTIYENAKLRAQLFDKVSEQKDTNKGTDVNTQFSKQSVLGKPPSSEPKLYSVTPFPKSMVIPKIGKSNALSKPVTSNSAPSSRESTIVNNERVIALGIFRINPFKASMVDNFVPNKHVKTSIRTKPNTVSQPNVITKNDVNSKTNGFSPKDVKSTTRTRRPYPRNNPKNDKVPFKSKSSCLSNKLEKKEENHRSLQSSNYSDHMSSACNNINLQFEMKNLSINQRTKQIMETMNVTLDKLSGMACNQMSDCNSFFRLKENSWKVYSVICSTNYSNGENQVVSKSSAVTTADASDKRQQQQDSTSSTSTLATTITADGNFDFKNQRDLPRNTPLDRVEVLGSFTAYPIMNTPDQRHQYLRYEGLQYTNANVVDFETRLARIYMRQVHRVHVFDFEGLPDLMDEGLRGRMLMEHRFGEAVLDLDTTGALQFWFILGRECEADPLQGGSNCLLDKDLICEGFSRYTPFLHSYQGSYAEITLRVGEERIIFKSVKPTSSLIKRVYMLNLRERIELGLEARLMGETLVINRSLDPLNGDYIELNDLNEPFELRRNQGDDLMSTIEEGEVIKEFRTRDDELDTGIDDYPSCCDYDKKIHIDCAYNLKFSCMIGFEFTHVNFFPLLYVNVMSKKFHNSIMKDKMVYKGNNVIGALMNVPIFVGTFSVVTDFAVLEDMDAYRDEGMGDVIFGEPFLREVGIKARRFEGMITIYNGNESVTYQMVRSHPRFKHHTNEQCNKIPPLLKVSDEDKKNGISHPYQKLKGFYKGVLNLGPDYIRDAKTEEWLTRGHISVHEMEW
ncbi:hypothetical protein Tco_0086322 [Tanacetum coccineum]